MRNEREVGKQRARQAVQEKEQGVRGVHMLGSRPGAAGGVAGVVGGTVPSGCVRTPGAQRSR